MSLDRMKKYFRRFNGMRVDYIYTDMHIHSSWTDGKASIPDIVTRAEQLGMKTIAITDHVRSSSTYFDAYFEEIESVRSGSPTRILAGFEARVKNFKGDIDASSADIKKADIVVASVHRIPAGCELLNPGDIDKDECQDLELELSLATIRNGGFDILGHPGAMSLKAHNEFKTQYFEKIISACAENNIVFELNSAYHLPVLHDIVCLLKRHNPTVSLGSDAHGVDEVGSWIKIWDGKTLWMDAV